MFLERLTDEEMETFFVKMRAEVNTLLPSLPASCKIGEHLSRHVGTKALFHFAYNVLFDEFPKTAEIPGGWNTVYDEVLSRVQELKEKLKTISDATKNALFDLSPEESTAFNTHTGDVAISHHAITRFSERGGVSRESPKNVLKKFREAFERAFPVTLSPEHAVRRILNNKFEKADYFFDQKTNLRFVVSPKTHCIVTVERPS